MLRKARQRQARRGSIEGVRLNRLLRETGTRRAGTGSLDVRGGFCGGGRRLGWVRGRVWRLDGAALSGIGAEVWGQSGVKEPEREGKSGNIAKEPVQAVPVGFLRVPSGSLPSRETSMPIQEVAVVHLLLTVFDLLGTFAFAISGAIAGARHKLDVFGVLVLSFAAATFGGITRDVLIGALPPASIQDWRYLAVSLLAGVITFFWHSKVSRVRHAVLIFDAAGLGLFAVTGTGKALAYSLNPIAAALLGMLTGIGGGVVRDVLVSEVPAVFRTEIYAVAALAGASAVVIGNILQWPPQPVAIGGALLCFGIRMMAIYRRWQVPVSGTPEPAAE